MAWTEEKVKRLKELWKKGYSTGEIGRMIGVSKNAVVGKAHRLGLDSRPSPIKPDRDSQGVKEKIKPKEKIKETAKKPEKLKGKEAGEKGSAEPKKDSGVRPDGISLLELTKSSCRWPQGDPKEKGFSFCGKPAIEGRPYCMEHVKEAYVGIEKRGHKKDD